MTSFFSLLIMKGAALTCSVLKACRSTMPSNSRATLIIFGEALPLTCSTSFSKFANSWRLLCTGVPVISTRRLTGILSTCLKAFVSEFLMPWASSQRMQSKFKCLKNMTRSSLLPSTLEVVKTKVGPVFRRLS
eukprot:Skav234199  [mRNA]  locus=scaffold2795:2899:5252:- [translate_table: standard]